MALLLGNSWFWRLNLSIHIINKDWSAAFLYLKSWRLVFCFLVWVFPSCVLRQSLCHWLCYPHGIWKPSARCGFVTRAAVLTCWAKGIVHAMYLENQIQECAAKKFALVLHIFAEEPVFPDMSYLFILDVWKWMTYLLLPCKISDAIAPIVFICFSFSGARVWLEIVCVPVA